MKKYIAIIMMFVLCLSALVGCGNDNKVKTIGILQYGEHASLDNCRLGFIQGLKDAGLKEGKDFNIKYQNASFDDNVATQIAQSFSSQNVALMCGIATPAAIACFSSAEDKDTPVIFNAITDPVKAKLDKGNITGVSDKLPIESQLEMIRKIQPNAKTIGIVYTTSEQNSVSAIEEYKEKAGKYGFTIEAKGVTAQSEVTLAIDTLISKKVNCISNLTDNNVVGVLPSILEKTFVAKIPVYGSEIEQVKKGCVAAAGIDYVKLGKQAGKLAVKIIKGEAKASEIPYETMTEFEYYQNSESLSSLGLHLPDNFTNVKDVVN